jgi:hypothetical protein
VKPKTIRYRPPQNYIHAIFGLLIIALALYQVHTGYHIEWPETTGRAPLPDGVDIIFWIWAAVSDISGITIATRSSTAAVTTCFLWLRSEFLEEAIPARTKKHAINEVGMMRMMSRLVHP